MPLLEKEIIAPDDYHTPDGIVRATPKRIRWWLKQFKRMKAKGLPVPVPWEHQEGAKPDEATWLSDQAKHNAGQVEDMFLAKDGVLWGVLDIGKDADVEQIKTNVRYVSPEIDDRWEDGDGEVWKDIITHVALTPRPVHYKQSRFGTKAKLSSARVTQLSMADRVNSPEKCGLRMYAQLLSDLAGHSEKMSAGTKPSSKLEEGFSGDTEEELCVQLCNDLVGDAIDEPDLDSATEEQPQRLQGRLRRLAKPDGGSGRLAYNQDEKRDEAGRWSPSEIRTFRKDYREKRRVPAKLTRKLWHHVVRLPLYSHTEPLIDAANHATNLLPDVDPIGKHRAALQGVRSAAFAASHKMQLGGPGPDEDEASHQKNLLRVKEMGRLAHVADKHLAGLETHSGRPESEGGFPSTGRPPRLGHVRRTRPWQGPGPTPERAQEVLAELMVNCPLIRP